MYTTVQTTETSPVHCVQGLQVQGTRREGTDKTLDVVAMIPEYLYIASLPMSNQHNTHIGTR